MDSKFFQYITNIYFYDVMRLNVSFLNHFSCVIVNKEIRLV
uniref:Uncharacterized protein n=1 Tax=Lepeophtheirus salmonis TaxID=72036 RepID=A0A0K2U158_LEPSM